VPHEKMCHMRRYAVGEDVPQENMCHMRRCATGGYVPQENMCHMRRCATGLCRNVIILNEIIYEASCNKKRALGISSKTFR
jgi:hypothetical protein